MHLALASASVGRKDLLLHLKIPFTTVPSTLDEDKIWGKNPLSTLQLRAKLKGEEVVKKIATRRYTLDAKCSLILSADSGAIIDNQLIGKPKNYKDAVRILKTLSGKTHEFVTAIYVIIFRHLAGKKIASTSDTEVKIWQTYDTSFVTFRKLSDEDIKLYLSLTKYTKFAGGYALASAQNFITKVQGSISNVIGLPMEKVIPIFRENKLL